MNNPFQHSEEYLDYLMSLPKELYIKILENLFLGVFVSDQNGKTIYVNPAISRHYGKLPGHEKAADLPAEKYAVAQLYGNHRHPRHERGHA